MNVDFYKEFYFKEIERKFQLNEAVNIPVFIISIIVTVQFYFYSQNLNISVLCICEVISVFTLISLSYSVYFLIRSFTNFHKNHTYIELAHMSEFYKYEKQLLAENTAAVAKVQFEEFLKQELSNCAGISFEVNRKRTEDIAKCKKGLFFGFIFTLLFSLIYIISIL